MNRRYLIPAAGEVEVPRIRTIKPELWESPDVMNLTTPQALLWVWLISQADDAGRLHGGPAWIARRFGRLSPPRVAEALAKMAAAGMIELYAVDGAQFLYLKHWAQHQVINRPTKSTIPAPPNQPSRPLTERSLRTHGGKDRKGTERKGREGSVREGKGSDGLDEKTKTGTAGNPPALAGPERPPWAEVAERVMERSRRNRNVEQP